MANSQKVARRKSHLTRLSSFVYLASLVVTLVGIYVAPQRSQWISLQKALVPILLLGLSIGLFFGVIYFTYVKWIRNWLKYMVTGKTASSSSSQRNSQKTERSAEDPLSLFERAFVTFDILILILFGHIRTLLCYLGMRKQGLFEKGHKGYVPLYDRHTVFYINNMFRRIAVALNNTICGVPGAEVDVKERMTPDYGWTFRFTGKIRKQVNLASYNYLGFAQSEGPCSNFATEAMHNSGLAGGSARNELGTHQIVKELEELTARFLGVDEAMVFPMGFATNSMNLPALVGKRCLVLSDELNHASIVLGCRLSGATCRTFRHADLDDLEMKLINNLLAGPSRTLKTWNKILIVVEGIYSMEGTIINLPRLIEIKKKYKCYLYLDEAHSIGALGPRGRGVVDYFNCDPKDVDVMMGTFTKSFGAAGGYIAGSKNLIRHLKTTSHNYYYGVSMPPPVAAQVISSMMIIMGEDGTNDGQLRLKQLSENTAYFRQRVRELGFTLLGADDSPVVVIMIYSYTKMLMQTEFQKLGIALVSVAFPVVPLGKARLRLCMSAGHTRKMLDRCIEILSKIGDRMNIKHSKKFIQAKSHAQAVKF